MRKNSQRILGQGRQSHAVGLGTMSVLTLVMAWFLVSAMGLVQPRFLPTPWRVVEAATDLRPNILVHAACTAGLVIIGLSLGSTAGIFLGILMRRSFLARSLLTPIIESWRPIPAVAIVPFFIIWFGFAWYGKIALIALASMLVVIVGTLEAIDRINPLYFRVALSFGADNAKLVDEVVMPAILPPLLASLRIALAISITVAVVAEYMGATRGIGHVLNVAMNTFATHTIVLCAIVLGLMGGFLDFILRSVHKRMVRWARTADEAIQVSVYKEERAG